MTRITSKNNAQREVCEGETLSNQVLDPITLNSVVVRERLKMTVAGCGPELSR